MAILQGESLLNDATALLIYRISVSAAIGALVVFGPGTGEHVCQVRHPGKNPTLYGHGADRSSHFVSLSVESTYHDAPVRFLSIAGL